MAARKKILVTGANGQLGKEIQELCINYPAYEFIFLARDDMPIDRFELVRTIFESTKPDYCINCAAYTAVDKAEEEKELAFQVNGEAAGVLAAVCLGLETKLVHISTDYVFDGKASEPYRESEPTSPVNVYGASKLKGEEEIFRFNPDAIIIRTSWLYSSFGKNFVKTMFRLMNEREEVKVVNDQFGSPTYAADLALLVMNIIEEKEWKPGLYHFSNHGNINWYQFASAIREITGSKCRVLPISTNEYPTPAKRPLYSVLDKKKIQDAFGIKLKDWKESLAECLKRLKV